MVVTFCGHREVYQQEQIADELDRQYDTSLYDRTLYPALENVPRRFAILKRNEYMVDAADIVVAYVKYEWGGAAKALEYARRRKKQIMWMGR